MFCSICQRNTPDVYIEKHHLVPRAKKGKETVPVCHDCGNQIHILFSLKELRDTYNTVEALLANDRVQTWIRWVRKKKDFGVYAKAKKRKI